MTFLTYFDFSLSEFLAILNPAHSAIPVRSIRQGHLSQCCKANPDHPAKPAQAHSGYPSGPSGRASYILLHYMWLHYIMWLHSIDPMSLHFPMCPYHTPKSWISYHLIASPGRLGYRTKQHQRHQSTQDRPECLQACNHSWHPPDCISREIMIKNEAASTTTIDTGSTKMPASCNHSRH